MKSALVIIDLINEIVHENGKFAGYGYPAQVTKRAIVARTNAALERARSKGIQPIFVRVGFSATYADCPAASPLFGSAKQYGALGLGTWATEFHNALAVGGDDLVIRKPRVSAFYGTPLEAALHANGVTRILLGGVATDLAIQTTARDGHDRDYQVVVLEDLCAAAAEEEHAAAITMLGKIAIIANSEDAI